MSSVILYVAIVAIWIGLLPRWLKNEHRGGHLTLRKFSLRLRGNRGTGGLAPRAGFSQDGRPRYTSFSGAPAGASNSSSSSDNSPCVFAPVSGNTDEMTTHLDETDTTSSPVRSYGWSAEEHREHEHAAGQSLPTEARSGGRGSTGQPTDGQQAGRQQAGGAAPARPGPESRAEAAERHARMVRGRRRMLWMLLFLTVVALGLALLNLAPWWILIPPVVLLAGYLLLLREAAHADAEARERHARQHAAESTQRSAQAAPAAAEAPQAPAAPMAPAASGPARETVTSAEVIDISERVNDQLYDQYADAKLRAVGD